MPISVMAIGTRGDVQPSLALAETLARRGHEVRFITHPGFAPLAEGRGIDFRPLTGMQGEFTGPEGKSIFTHGNNPITGFSKLISVVKSYARQWNRDLFHLAAGSDCLVGTTFTNFPAMCMSEDWKVPSFQTFYQPLSPTGDFPSIFLGSLGLRIPRFLNRVSHQLLNQIIWMQFRSLAKAAHVTGSMQKLPWRTPIGAASATKRPSFLAFSKHVFPRPKDWDPSLELTGFWFLDRPQDWQPDSDLARFLETGPKPIYIGFGSMGFDESRVMAILVDALSRCNCRVVLCSGWSGLQSVDLPHVLTVRDVPHDWLFPRMAAIVHHGGAGTTAATLRAGVPSVVVPFIADQPFWAARLQELGVAPRPIPYRTMTADQLTQAIDLALNDKAMHVAAEHLGRLIASEAGTAHAADRIEEALAARARGAG